MCVVPVHLQDGHHTHKVEGEDVAGPEALGKIYGHADSNVSYVEEPLTAVDDRVPAPATPSAASLVAGENALSPTSG
jgi:hypothetical protein